MCNQHWNSKNKLVDRGTGGINWCIPLLLDGMLTFLQKDYFDLSYRRTFNQAKILLDCILEDLRDQCDPAVYQFIMQFGALRKKTSNVSSNQFASKTTTFQ